MRSRQQPVGFTADASMASICSVTFIDANSANARAHTTTYDQTRDDWTGLVNHREKR